MPTPSPGPPRDKSDPLAGRWAGGNGNWYDFAPDGDEYEVVEGGPMGQTGDGFATLEGRTVTLTVTNIVLGEYTLELALKGDRLTGSINVMGMNMPLVLYRH